MKLEQVVGGSPSLQNTDNAIKQRPLAKNTSTVQIKDNQTVSKDEVINTKEIKTVVDALNNLIDPLRTNLKFEYHEELNEYYVTVVNPLTNEVIKEIPPKKMLDIYAEMVGLVGILVDKKI